MKISTRHIALFISLLIIAVFFVKQFEVAAYNKNIANEESFMHLAYEIIEASNSNFNLQNEVNRLEQKNASFSLDMKDRDAVRKDIGDKLVAYRKINGLEVVGGSGVEVIIEGSLLTEEMTDIMNGIRSTKPLGIAINGERVSYRSSFIIDNNALEFDNHRISIPFTVQIVGNADMLIKALSRSGGVLDSIEKNSFGKVHISLQEKEEISLPPYETPLPFRFARISTNL